MTTKPKKPVLPPRLEKRQNSLGKNPLGKLLGKMPGLKSLTGTQQKKVDQTLSTHKSATLDKIKPVKSQKLAVGGAAKVRLGQVNVKGVGSSFKEAPKVNCQSKEKIMTSYILEHEREQAREMVSSLMGCPLPEPLGTFIAVKLFVEESHIQKIAGRALIVPPSASCADRTRPHPALVIGKGNAVKDDYTLGDFIVIPRHQGVELSWYGHTVRFLEGDKTYSVLKSPDAFQLSEFNPTEGEHHVSVQ